MSNTTECERLHQVARFSQKIGEFIDWLRREKEVKFAQYHQHSDECFDANGDLACGSRNDELFPFRFSTNSLLAEFFGIDLEKVERERRELLEQIRKQQPSS
jgi:hypothetical protein